MWCFQLFMLSLFIPNENISDCGVYTFTLLAVVLSCLSWTWHHHHQSKAENSFPKAPYLDNSVLESANERNLWGVEGGHEMEAIILRSLWWWTWDSHIQFFPKFSDMVASTARPGSTEVATCPEVATSKYLSLGSHFTVARCSQPLGRVHRLCLFHPFHGFEIKWIIDVSLIPCLPLSFLHFPSSSLM